MMSPAGWADKHSAEPREIGAHALYPIGRGGSPARCCSICVPRQSAARGGSTLVNIGPKLAAFGPALADSEPILTDSSDIG